MYEIQKMLDACDKLRAKIDQLEHENADLRKDKERLEWMFEGKGNDWLYLQLYTYRMLNRYLIDQGIKERSKTNNEIKN